MISAATSHELPVLVRGIGSVGRRHIRVLGALPGTNVIACPVRSERIDGLLAEGIQAITFEEIPTAVRGSVIATETGRHLADLAALLPHGDVLVEKPLAVSAEGLEALRDKVDKGGRKVFVGFCLRFDASLRRFAARLPELGAVDSVRIVCESFLPDWRPGSDHRESYSARQSEGGVLRDLSHELDYACWLFGRPREVYALFGNSGRLGIESEDCADLLWKTDTGSRVAVRLSYLGRPARREIRAVGEHGELHWDGVSQRVTRIDVNGREDHDMFDEQRDAMYGRQAEAFLGACAGADPGTLATFEQGAFVVALSDAARRSAQTHRAERIRHWGTE